jgi:hypothetical protein
MLRAPLSICCNPLVCCSSGLSILQSPCIGFINIAIPLSAVAHVYVGVPPRMLENKSAPPQTCGTPIPSHDPPSRSECDQHSTARDNTTLSPCHTLHVPDLKPATTEFCHTFSCHNPTTNQTDVHRPAHGPMHTWRSQTSSRPHAHVAFTDQLTAPYTRVAFRPAEDPKHTWRPSPDQLSSVKYATSLETLYSDRPA